MKPRQNLYLDADLSAELDRLARKPGASKSAIVAEALKSLFEHNGSKERDDKLKPRPAKLSNHHHRLPRNHPVLIESLALYIRFHSSILPPLPEADQAAGGALADDRFQA